MIVADLAVKGREEGKMRRRSNNVSDGTMGH